MQKAHAEYGELLLGADAVVALHCCCFPSRPQRGAGDILEIAPPIFSSHMLNAVFLLPSLSAQPAPRGHVVLTPIRHFLTKLSIFAFHYVNGAASSFSKWDSYRRIESRSNQISNCKILLEP